jgi:hypothetical protein
MVTNTCIVNCFTKSGLCCDEVQKYQNLNLLGEPDYEFNELVDVDLDYEESKTNLELILIHK